MNGTSPGKWVDNLLSKRFFSSGWTFALTQGITAGVTVPISFIWTDQDRGTLWIVISVILYIVAVVLQWAIRAAESKSKTSTAQAVAEARDTTTRELCNRFASIPLATAEFFTRLRSPNSKPLQDFDTYLASMLDYVVNVVSAVDVRVCLYLVDGRDSKNGTSDAEKITSLTLSGSAHGRPDQPRPGFDGDEAHVQTIIRCMNERRTILVEDVSTPPPGIDIDCKDKKYQSFLAAPVIYTQHEYGMLMLDSPKASGLTSEHEVVAQLFASFIASAVHIVQQTRPVVAPRRTNVHVSVGRKTEEA